jgi:transposase
MSAPQRFVGSAVAKAPLEIALRPTGERGAVVNDAAGMAPRVGRLQALPPTWLVREAPGGSQRAVVAARRPVAVVHPRPARDVAQAPGQRAQTEALEARAWAQVAAAVRPPPRPWLDAQAAALRALRARRRPLGARRTAEQHRRGHAPPRLQTALQAPSTGRNTRLAAWDDDLDTTRRLDRPAWGTRSRQGLATLGGVAPLNRESGTLRGRRPSWGGRAHGRTALSRSPRVAVRDTPGLKVFYARLRPPGKAAKVARTACRRQRLTILNALVQHHTPWQAPEVPHASQTRPP